MSLSTIPWNYSSPVDTSPALASISVPSTVVTSPVTSPPSDAAFYPQAQALPPKISKMTVARAAITTTAPTATKKRRNISSKALELSEEDDWTKVKDPKEKKRIQNRVAQRTYRNRMKARLGELQARLDSHEKLLHLTATEVKDSALANGGISSIYTMASQPCAASNTLTTTTPTAKPSPSSVMQQNIYQPSGANSSEPSLFQEASDLLSSPTSSLPSPQSNSLHSPTNRTFYEQEAKLAQTFDFDRMHFQTQLLSRLNTLQQNPSYGASYANGEGVQSMLGEPSPAEQVQCIGTFTPTDSEGMEFGFDTGMDVWKTNILPNKPPSPSISADNLDLNGLPHSHSAAPLDPVMMNFHRPFRRGSHAVSSHKEGSFDERLERIMNLAETEGFDSFDALVEAYYCHTFDEGSPLANEQRLSRNRRLPKVLHGVFQAANQWTQWERRGFEEEILKTAETMLLTESANARGSLINKLIPLIEADDNFNNLNTNSAVSADGLLQNLKRSIQDEIPNSWALTMALASENRNSWQMDRSNAALATTLLLTFGGRIPNETLLQLINSCL